MSKSPLQDRRKTPRALGNVPLKISHREGDIVTETVNISRSGAYCKVDKYVDPMTKMKIHILLPLRKNDRDVTKKVACEGVVVRTEPAPEKGFFNIAVFFNEITRRDSDAIGDYVEHVLSREKEGLK
jgi:hypothetical protein